MKLNGMLRIFLFRRTYRPPWAGATQCFSRKYSTEFIVRSSENVHIPSIPFTDEVWRNSERWAGKTALVCGVTGRSYTYAQLKDSCDRFGSSLLKLGFRPREVLGIISPNTPEFAIAALGTSGVDGIITAVNPALTAEEIAAQLEKTEVKYLVTVSSLLPLIKTVNNIYSGIQNMIVIGETNNKCITFSDMVKEDGGESHRPQNIDVQNTSVLLFSSGTTGPLKAVTLSHYNIVTMMTIWSKLQLYTKTKDSFQDVFLAVIPFFHIYGMVAILFLGLSHGAKIVTLAGFEPASFVKAMDYYRSTLLHLVTPMFAFLSDYPAVQQEYFERVHTIILGAAPVGMALMNKLKKKMHPVLPKFKEVYALTECAPLTAVTTTDYPQGSCGTVVPNTRIKVVDTETGQILGPNKSGEIYAQGPQIMKEYLKNPEATAATIVDGWLRTGDVGYYDENGFFFIVDRVKELIKVKGFQVVPSELEDILRKHVSVVDAAVIGIPDEKSGELPRAYVTVKDSTVTEQDILTFVEKNVASYKRLQGGIKFVDVIPRSASGKILRRILKEDKELK